MRRGSDAVHLTPKAFELLNILVRERPKVVPQQTLYDRLWPDTFVGQGSLHNLVSQIREALGDRGHQIVRTAYGTGFSFAAATAVEDAPPASSCRIEIGDAEFELRAGENVVGRDWNAKVRIDSSSVSRRHACIVISGNEATIQDLGSKNGTTVNGRRLRSAIALSDGDKVLFGTIAAVFRVLATPASTETAVR